MTMTYVKEIKNRVILIILAFCLTSLTAYFYKETLMFKMLQNANAISIFSKQPLFYFIFTDITEIFSVNLNLIFFISFQVFFIFSIYHSFTFFSLALFYEEYKLARLTVKVLFFTWFLSIILANKFFIPLTWEFFLSYQDSLLKTNCLNIHFEINILKFCNYCFYLYFICFCYSNVFFLFSVFFYYSNFNSKNIQKLRKFYYFCFFAFSFLIAIDVFSYFLITFLLIIFFEILLLLLIINNYISNNKNFITATN